MRKSDHLDSLLANVRPSFTEERSEKFPPSNSPVSRFLSVRVVQSTRVVLAQKQSARPPSNKHRQKGKFRLRKLKKFDEIDQLPAIATVGATRLGERVKDQEQEKRRGTRFGGYMRELLTAKPSQGRE